MHEALKWVGLGLVGSGCASAAGAGTLSVMEILKLGTFMATVVLACFKRGKVFSVWALSSWAIRVGHLAYMGLCWQQMEEKWQAMFTSGKGHISILLTVVFDQMIVLHALPQWLADVLCVMHAVFFGVVVHRYLLLDDGASIWYHAMMCLVAPQVCTFLPIWWTRHRSAAHARRHLQTAQAAHQPQDQFAAGLSRLRSKSETSHGPGGMQQSSVQHSDRSWKARSKSETSLQQDGQQPSSLQIDCTETWWHCDNQPLAELDIPESVMLGKERVRGTPGGVRQAGFSSQRQVPESVRHAPSGVIHTGSISHHYSQWCASGRGFLRRCALAWHGPRYPTHDQVLDAIQTRPYQKPGRHHKVCLKLDTGMPYERLDYSYLASQIHGALQTMDGPCMQLTSIAARPGCIYISMDITASSTDAMSEASGLVPGMSPDVLAENALESVLQVMEMADTTCLDDAAVLIRTVQLQVDEYLAIAKAPAPGSRWHVQAVQEEQLGFNNLESSSINSGVVAADAGRGCTRPWLGVAQLTAGPDPCDTPPAMPAAHNTINNTAVQASESAPHATTDISAVSTVQVWDLGKLDEVVGWQPPAGGTHAPAALAWESEDRSPGYEGSQLSLLARFPWGGYASTHVLQVQLSVPVHLLLQHHPGAPYNSLMMCTLELYNDLEVLLSSTPLLTILPNPNSDTSPSHIDANSTSSTATLGQKPAVQAICSSTDSMQQSESHGESQGHGSAGSVQMAAWWWGASDRVLASAVSELQLCVAALMEGGQYAKDTVRVWLPFVQDLMLWLLEVQRLVLASGVCHGTSASAGQTSPGASAAAALRHEQGLQYTVLQQLWQGLVEHAQHVQLHSVHSMLQQQWQRVVTPAHNRMQQQQQQQQHPTGPLTYVPSLMPLPSTRPPILPSPSAMILSSPSSLKNLEDDSMRASSFLSSNSPLNMAELSGPQAMDSLACCKTDDIAGPDAAYPAANQAAVIHAVSPAYPATDQTSCTDTGFPSSSTAANQAAVTEAESPIPSDAAGEAAGVAPQHPTSPTAAGQNAHGGTEVSSPSTACGGAAEVSTSRRGIFPYTEIAAAAGACQVRSSSSCMYAEGTAPESVMLGTSTSCVYTATATSAAAHLVADTRRSSNICTSSSQAAVKPTAAMPQLRCLLAYGSAFRAGMHHAMWGYKCDQCEQQYKERLCGMLGPVFWHGNLVLAACCLVDTLSGGCQGWSLCSLMFGLPRAILYLLPLFISLTDKPQYRANHRSAAAVPGSEPAGYDTRASYAAVYHAAAHRTAAWCCLAAYWWRIVVQLLLWWAGRGVDQLGSQHPTSGTWLFVNLMISIYTQMQVFLVLPAASVMQLAVLVEFPCMLLYASSGFAGPMANTWAAMPLSSTLLAVLVRSLLDAWARTTLMSHSGPGAAGFRQEAHNT